jgi:hypothetical protein
MISASRRHLLLHFPALAGKQHGARHFVFAGGIVGDLPAGKTECFRRFGQTESVLPPPTDEFRTITVAVLSKGEIPEGNSSRDRRHTANRIARSSLSLAASSPAQPAGSSPTGSRKQSNTALTGATDDIEDGRQFVS